MPKSVLLGAYLRRRGVSALNAGMFQSRVLGPAQCLLARVYAVMTGARLFVARAGCMSCWHNYDCH